VVLVHRCTELPPELRHYLADLPLYSEKACVGFTPANSVFGEKAVPVGWKDSLEGPLPEVVPVRADG
jgi:hypothetical protein